MAELPTRSLGAVTTPALGLGCMSMSGVYGPASEEESTATIHAALDAGLTLLDTGDFYAAGHNEMLIGAALSGVPRSSVQLSVKFGALLTPGGGMAGFDARPSAVRSALTYSLTRLRTEYVDVYRPARLDPSVPIEETIGAIAELVSAGYVRHIGLSEVGASTIRRAHAVHPISDLQIEYSLLSRSPESVILDVCQELGVGLTAYGVLSRGLISDRASASAFGGAGDFRAHSPRFQGENLTANLALVDRLRSVAASHGVTVAQLAIAWVLAQRDFIVPLVGARTRSRLSEALGSLAVSLTPSEWASIEEAVPADAVAGTRYAAAQMQALDSER